MKVRVARLYPLYLLGLVFGFSLTLLQFRLDGNSLSTKLALIPLVLGFIMLPTLSASLHWSHQALTQFVFPYNIPAWSLFFEVFVNLLHALALRRKSWRTLAATLIISGAGVIYSAQKIGSLDFGSRIFDFIYAVPRVIFAYAIGYAIFHIWRSGRFMLNIPPAFCAFLLLLALALRHPLHHQAEVDLVIVFFFLPLLLLLSANSSMPQGTRQAAVCRVVGTSSFAIYALHHPFISVLVTLRNMLELQVHGLSGKFGALGCGLIYLFAVFLLALLADYFYDAPARAFLRRKLVR